MPLPNTVQGWERAKREQQRQQLAPQKAPPGAETLAKLLASAAYGTERPGEGMVPWSSLPRAMREQFGPAIRQANGDKAGHDVIGWAPSELDPQSYEMLNRMVQLGQREQEPNRLKAEQEAQAKLDADARLMASR